MREGVPSRISRPSLRPFVTREIYALDGKSSPERLLKEGIAKREGESRETVITSRGKFQQIAEECTLMAV